MEINQETQKEILSVLSVLNSMKESKPSAKALKENKDRLSLLVMSLLPEDAKENGGTIQISDNAQLEVIPHEYSFFDVRKFKAENPELHDKYMESGVWFEYKKKEASAPITQEEAE